MPAAPQCLFAGISIRGTGCGEKNKEQDAQRRGLGKRIRNRVFKGMDWGKEQGTGCSMTLTFGRKKEVGEVSERNVTGIQGEIGRNSGNGD